MTKVRGPLFSVSASGPIGSGVYYQKRPSGHGAQAHNYRKWVSSPGRASVGLWWRKGVAVFRGVVAGYSFYSLCYFDGLNQDERNVWIRESYSVRLTGISYFMSLWLYRSFRSLWQYQDPFGTGFCLCGEWKSGDLISGGGFILHE